MLQSYKTKQKIEGQREHGNYFHNIWNEYRKINTCKCRSQYVLQQVVAFSHDDRNNNNENNINEKKGSHE